MAAALIKFLPFEDSASEIREPAWSDVDVHVTDEIFYVPLSEYRAQVSGGEETELIEESYKTSLFPMFTELFQAAAVRAAKAVSRRSSNRRRGGGGDVFVLLFSDTPRLLPDALADFLHHQGDRHLPRTNFAENNRITVLTNNAELPALTDLVERVRRVRVVPPDPSSSYSSSSWIERTFDLISRSLMRRYESDLCARPGFGQLAGTCWFISCVNCLILNDALRPLLQTVTRAYIDNLAHEMRVQPADIEANMTQAFEDVSSSSVSASCPTLRTGVFLLHAIVFNRLLLPRAAPYRRPRALANAAYELDVQQKTGAASFFASSLGMSPSPGAVDELSVKLSKLHRGAVSGLAMLTIMRSLFPFPFLKIIHLESDETESLAELASRSSSYSSSRFKPNPVLIGTYFFKHSRTFPEEIVYANNTYVLTSLILTLGETHEERHTIAAFTCGGRRFVFDPHDDGVVECKAGWTEKEVCRRLRKCQTLRGSMFCLYIIRGKEGADLQQQEDLDAQLRGRTRTRTRMPVLDFRRTCSSSAASSFLSYDDFEYDQAKREFRFVRSGLKLGAVWAADGGRNSRTLHLEAMPPRPFLEGYLAAWLQAGRLTALYIAKIDMCAFLDLYEMFREDVLMDMTVFYEVKYRDGDKDTDSVVQCFSNVDRASHLLELLDEETWTTGVYRKPHQVKVRLSRRSSAPVPPPERPPLLPRSPLPPPPTPRRRLPTTKVQRARTSRLKVK